LYWVYYFCERKSASNKTFICGCLLSAHEVWRGPALRRSIKRNGGLRPRKSSVPNVAHFGQYAIVFIQRNNQEHGQKLFVQLRNNKYCGEQGKCFVQCKVIGIWTESSPKGQQSLSRWIVHI
jgi:hypothetical protein